MKVLLVGNYLRDGQPSMQRFTTLMASGLSEAGHQVRVLRPPALVGKIGRAGEESGKWLGYIDKFAIFPAILPAAVRWSDVVHICDHSNSIYVKYLQGVPHVVTCHDLLGVRSALGEIPQNQTRWTGRQLQRQILSGLSKAQHIVCVSEATRADLLRVAGVPETRVSRVYNALGYPYSPMNREEATFRVGQLLIDPNHPFLLHVGGNQWYKNRLGVLRIFLLLRKCSGRTFNLVMVGKAWTKEMRHFVAENELGCAVTELTAVEDEDLRALYSTATMMLFPSLQEGFGWPIVEAQACGCPVVTSRRSPMSEVGGNAAVYVDPDNPESAAAVVESYLDRVKSLRQASLNNAARFNRSAMIRSYLSLFEKVCSHNVSPVLA